MQILFVCTLIWCAPSISNKPPSNADVLVQAVDTSGREKALRLIMGGVGERVRKNTDSMSWTRALPGRAWVFSGFIVRWCFSSKHLYFFFCPRVSVSDDRKETDSELMGPSVSWTWPQSSSYWSARLLTLAKSQHLKCIPKYTYSFTENKNDS